VLDLTNPSVLDYLRLIFRTWRRDWGVEIFKVDGTAFGLDWGPDQVTYHRSGLTRIEAWTAFAQMDAVWMASGQPLWASIGIADTMRIGGDVGVDWYGITSAQSLLRDLPTRNFTNNILWQVDPDDVLLRRQNVNLSSTEIRSLAFFDAMSGGVMSTGDNLAELPGDRISLWKSILVTSRANASYPLLGRSVIHYVPYQDPASGNLIPVDISDPVIVQVRDNGGSYTVHILNTATEPISRSLQLTDLGIQNPKVVFDWLANVTSAGPVDRISVSLDPHSSSLLLLFDPAASSTSDNN
jgi:hypothetical protein